MLDKGSLTRRLQAQCSGGFRVEVQQQGFACPTVDEARQLKIRPRTRVLIRTVVLYCGSEPWVVARSAIPFKTLRGRQRRLLYLGERPLGAVLFADPSLMRSEIEMARVALPMPLAASRGTGGYSGSCWARRSVFQVDQKPLLVCECFLDQLLAEVGLPLVVDNRL